MAHDSASGDRAWAGRGRSRRLWFTQADCCGTAGAAQRTQGAVAAISEADEEKTRADQAESLCGERLISDRTGALREIARVAGGDRAQAQCAGLCDLS